jgi:hypothetical protein
MILKLIKSKQLQENKNISEIEEIIKPKDNDIVDK